MTRQALGYKQRKRTIAERLARLKAAHARIVAQVEACKMITGTTRQVWKPRRRLINLKHEITRLSNKARKYGPDARSRGI